MKIHRKIQTKLKEKYEKKGYIVEPEATIVVERKKYRVDILAIKNNEKLVVEVGRGNPIKIKDLIKSGYIVKKIDFHFVDKDGFFNCICGYRWYPRVTKPKACPECKQYLYYPRKEKGTGKWK